MFTKYLPKWNIETSYFKVDEVDLIESLIQPNTKVLYIETPTNPAVDILDLDLIGKIAKNTILFLLLIIALQHHIYNNQLNLEQIW